MVVTEAETFDGVSFVDDQRAVVAVPFCYNCRPFVQLYGLVTDKFTRTYNAHDTYNIQQWRR